MPNSACETTSLLFQKILYDVQQRVINTGNDGAKKCAAVIASTRMSRAQKRVKNNGNDGEVMPEREKRYLNHDDEQQAPDDTEFEDPFDGIEREEVGFGDAGADPAPQVEKYALDTTISQEQVQVASVHEETVTAPASVEATAQVEEEAPEVTPATMESQRELGPYAQKYAHEELSPASDGKINADAEERRDATIAATAAGPPKLMPSALPTRSPGSHPTLPCRLLLPPTLPLRLPGTSSTPS